MVPFKLAFRIRFFRQQLPEGVFDLFFEIFFFSCKAFNFFLNPSCLPLHNTCSQARPLVPECKYYMWSFGFWRWCGGVGTWVNSSHVFSLQRS